MTWIYRITTNVALNMLRARKVREPVLTVVDDEPSVGVGSVEARDLLRKWIDSLTEREQQVATLLFLDGLTQEEIADVLGLSRKTIGRELAELREKAASLGAVPRGDP